MGCPLHFTVKLNMKLLYWAFCFWYPSNNILYWDLLWNNLRTKTRESNRREDKLKSPLSSSCLVLLYLLSRNIHRIQLMLDPSRLLFEDKWRGKIWNIMSSFLVLNVSRGLFYTSFEWSCSNLFKLDDKQPQNSAIMLPCEKCQNT